MSGLWQTIRHTPPYHVYVLVFITLAYLMNQTDRYLLSNNSKAIAADIHFGSSACGLLDGHTSVYNCSEYTEQSVCQSHENCSWIYDGTGFEYELLAGPLFVVTYTFIGVLMGALAQKSNRKNFLAACLFFWSAMTFVTGFSTEYWHLVVTRMGLGIGEAGCTPFATSILSDYFGKESRTTALSIYNTAIYIGSGVSVLFNLVEVHYGWRWTFYGAGIPGILFAIVIFFTVREPIRGQSDKATNGEKIDNVEEQKILKSVNQGEDEVDESEEKPLLKKADLSSIENSHQQKSYTLWEVLKFFVNAKSLLLLCLAGGIRNAGGTVWAFNYQQFFKTVRNLSPSDIAVYMSWIPVVSGLLGVLVGGIISDHFVKKRGPTVRLLILVASQALAAPFGVAALLLPTPAAFFMLIPCSIIGEMWVGVTMTMVVEVVPVFMRTTAVAVYFFIISNIGGNATLLVSYLQDKVGLKYSLLIMFPGLYAASSLLFLLTLFVLKRDIEAVKEMVHTTKKEGQEVTS